MFNKLKRRLNCILLIDDNDDENLYHTRIIKKADVANKIKAINNGEDALTYLKTMDHGEFPKPDLIFLDINMPGMDGWEFLEEYENLDDNIKAGVVVMMLSTSLNYDQQKPLKASKSIDGFKPKPLTQQMLLEILEENFPDYWSG